MKQLTWTELSDRKTREEFCRRTGFVDALRQPNESKIPHDRIQPDDIVDTRKFGQAHPADC